MKQFYTLIFFLACFGFSQSAQAQCDPPSIVWNEDGLLLNWIAKDGATSHIIRYRDATTFTWTEVEIPNNTFFDISFLESCVEYDFRVRTVCGDDQSSFTPIYSAFPNCGVCYQEYCEVPKLNDNSTFIKYVRVNDFVQESTSTGTGYEDFRGYPEIVLAPGAEVTMEFRMNDQGFTLGNTILTYVDFNRDTEFTPDELIFLESIVPFEPVIITTTIPADIDFGISRMRSIIVEFNYDDVDPCDNPSSPIYGEVEEYCVILGELPSACDFDFTVELESITEEQVKFTWDELSAAQAYNFRYKKTEESEEEWSELATIDPEAFLLSLDDCTEYEFEVRGVCFSDTSAYKNRVVFQSFCPTAINEDPLLISEITIYPNPWSSSLNLQFNTKESDEISITAVDVEGKRYDLVSDVFVTEGENKISINNTEALSAGVYFIELTNSENRRWYHKALKIK